jgi:hypothetical protein
MVATPGSPSLLASVVAEHVVLIAAADLLPALKARVGAEARELISFTDTEALRALEVITTRRPARVLLERKFAATPRGAALINRIKADPSLVDTEIRVVSPDGSAEPEAYATPSSAPAATGAHQERAAAPTHSVQASLSALDYRGTRRATRFRMNSDREVLVDGNRGTLVDLSTIGAQLLTTSVLKPNQRVRVSVADEDRPIRCVATVVWASFEIPRGAGPRYRAGLDFVEPDASALDAYIRRHKQA